LEQIDRFFSSNEWEAIYPAHKLHSLSSLCFDHGSLLLHTDDGCMAKKRFHFHAFWPRFPGFADMVVQAWHCSFGNVSSFAKLVWLLCNMTCCLKSWSDQRIGSFKTQLEILKEVVHRLEVA
jgi:hypothetical protein